MNDGFNAEKLVGSYYGQMVADDIISKFSPILATAGYKLRYEDGKITASIPGIGWDTPWHHVSSDHFLDCQTWHRVLFDLFSRTMPPGSQFVPTGCQNCWKVVVRPKTLLGLFALLHIELRMDVPSKCGIEIRETVHGLYGGYFYTHSLEEGIERYKAVREAVSAEKNLGPETTVLLKRACTEYEMLVGDSDKWEVTDEQRRIELLVNRWYVRDHTMVEQPDCVKKRVHRKWIEWAFANGDSTYLNFTNGEPLYKPYVTYHHLADPENADEYEEQKKKFARQCYFPVDF